MFSLASNSSVVIDTDSVGKATAEFTANRYPGSYTISASVIGEALAVTFQEENVAIQPVAIVEISGDNQVTSISSLFHPLMIKLSDGDGPFGTKKGNFFTNSVCLFRKRPEVVS